MSPPSSLPCHFNGESRGDSPDPVEEQDKKRGCQAKFQSGHTLRGLQGENDKQLDGAWGETEQCPFREDIHIPERQQEQQTPETAPDDAGIQKACGQGRRDCDPRRPGNPGGPEKPDRQSVGRSSQTTRRKTDHALFHGESLFTFLYSCIDLVECHFGLPFIPEITALNYCLLPPINVIIK